MALAGVHTPRRSGLNRRAANRAAIARHQTTPLPLFTNSSQPAQEPQKTKAPAAHASGPSAGRTQARCRGRRGRTLRQLRRGRKPLRRAPPEAHRSEGSLAAGQTRMPGGLPLWLLSRWPHNEKVTRREGERHACQRRCSRGCARPSSNQGNRAIYLCRSASPLNPHPNPSPAGGRGAFRASDRLIPA